jgi:hypothetical protein
MSDCKQFEVPLRYSNEGEHGSRDGYARITYAFDGNRDDGVMLTISDSALSAQIHTTEKSLVELALQIIKVLG